MECTQVLLSESFDANNAVTEKSRVATLLIEGEYYTIYNTENVIGRESSCDVVISNSAVSSKHAVIEAEDSDAHLIYDLGSTNKTRLGKMVLKPHVRYHINDGDYVTFGNVSAKYNVSREYPTTPVKGETSLNSCSIPETPERLVATLELASNTNGKVNVEVDNSALELSDTDLFDEKVLDNNINEKVISSSLSKTSSDIYELDTLSFDENIEKHIENIAPAEDLQKNSDDVKHVSKGLSVHDEGRAKNRFGWEDFPEIASPVGLDTSSADNLECPKSKISSSFLDITTDGLKSVQDVPKNVGGVILSDLCKSTDVESLKLDLNNQNISSTSKEGELKTFDETEKKFSLEETIIGPKNSYNCDLVAGEYPENDCYIPMSQNVDMFEETPEKRMDDCSEQGDVYEMLTQVSAVGNENKEDSIYDIQTQVVIPDNYLQSENDIKSNPSFISPPGTKRFSILEPATQPESNDNEVGKNTSYLKDNVIDETDNNFSFSESIYEAATQPCMQNSIKEKALTNKKQLNENIDSPLAKAQNKNGRKNNLSTSMDVSAPETIPEILNPSTGKTNINDSISSIMFEVATQPCPQSSVKIRDSVSAEIDESGENESLSTTIIEGATQPCPVEASMDELNQNHTLKAVEQVTDEEVKNSSLSASMFEAATQPCSLDKPELLLEKINNDPSEKMLVTDISMCNWFEIATQPCRTTTEEKVEIIEQELQNEATVINNEIVAPQDNMFESFPSPATKDQLTNNNEQNNSFSASMYEIATQPCPTKDVLSEKTVSIDETNLDLEVTTMNDLNDKNKSFSASICEIATQPCPKDVFSEKTACIDETNLGLEMTTMNDQNKSFSASICEIATQPYSLSTVSTTDRCESIKNDGNLLLNESGTMIDNECIKVNINENELPQIRKEINIEIEPNLDGKSMLSSEIIQEVDTLPFLHAETTSKSLVKSVKLVKESLNDLFEGENMNPLPVDQSKNVLSSESIVKQKETMLMLDSSITSSFFEVATQPAPSKVDLNLHGNENIPLIPILETSCDVKKDLKEVSQTKSDVDKEHTNNFQVAPKPNDISLTTTLPNTLSDSFFEAATQPYKNDESGDKTFPDPLTSICNDLSDDKVGKITEELMFGNISAKLGDKNQTIQNSKCNEDVSELRKKTETSDDNIYEALTHQVPSSSQKNILCNKLNHENPSEKISTQDLKRILESDDLTQKYDDFKNSNATSTVSDHNINSELGLLKNNVNLMKDETQNLEHCDISRNEKITGGGSHKSQTEKHSCDSESKSSLEQDVPHVIEDIQNFASGDGTKDFSITENKESDKSVSDSKALGIRAVVIDSDSSQELNIRSNKKRSNVFPPDSQSCTNQFLDHDDSSQELNIRSYKKRPNAFPPDSESFTNKSLDDNNSSQELNIRSKKKRYNIFPDSQDFIKKNLETPSNLPDEECIKTTEECIVIPQNKKFDSVNTASTDSLISKISNNIQKPNDVYSGIVSNTSVEKDEQSDTKDESMSSNNNQLETNNLQAKAPKGKVGEKISTPCKRNSKENKNKLPSERERESTYISRGNITLHSPEVLSELEEQFRLTKVAMSPTQLSVVSDIEDDIQSSQEVNELDKDGIRRSIRNRRNAIPKKKLKDNKTTISQKNLEPAAVMTNEKLSDENENKKKDADSFSGTSKREKSFKKFKKVSPLKLDSPVSEKTVKVETNEAHAEIVCNSSENSQNSEELGRGKRKRVRTSYEGFILEEDKKRTPRKKLFSNSEDSESMNNETAKPEGSNTVVFDEVSSNHQNNNVLTNNAEETLSVFLQDNQKVSAEVSEPKVEKNIASKKKASSLTKKNKPSHNLTDKISNLPSSSIKDEAKAKQNETSSKDKNQSFSFTEKLDELFNIWGPADRVKLSPRVAKKSYKLIADGKTQSISPITNGKKSQTNISDNELKPSTTRANKNSLKTIEKKNEPVPVVGTSTNSSSRKRDLPQKNEAAESSDDLSKQNKKRRKNDSENSETSVEPDTNDRDSEVRKSSRITRKKNLDIPVSDCKLEKNLGQIKRPSSELLKRLSNRSSEGNEDSASFSNKNIKSNIRNLSNTSMKPPLNTVVVNVKSKNLKTKERKNPVHIEENPSTAMHEEDYCFSQEYSFHESKVEKGRKKSSGNGTNPPLIIRRSGRKKNDKTVEKNVENVMFTGFADKKTKSLVNVLGGQIVESPFTCTVLVTDKIRRTTKFLSALSRGLPIVSPQWLVDSNENGRFMDASDFLLSDHEAESMFSFDLKKSIEKAQNGKVLAGWAIFVTPSVKPSPEEMKNIVECSGGRFLSKELTRWPTNSLIVSCEEDRAMWPKFSKKGKTPIIVDNEAILLGVLRQELDIESHRLL